jgi:hypothetical protein
MGNGLVGDRGSRAPQPLILVRGFGGLGVEDEKRIAYQGFNDGTVYPGKRGENYIYEGLILRFLKSHWTYQDATNVVGYYGSELAAPSVIPPELQHLPASFFQGKIVIDPAMALALRRRVRDPSRTLWVFRYYDLDDRRIAAYGEGLRRLIEFIRALAAEQGQAPVPRVNIIAHSMGGLIVRQAVQVAYPDHQDQAAASINKIVTLGTPHRGITFQILKEWIGGAADEMEHFNPEFQERRFLNETGEDGKPLKNRASYHWFGEHFPAERLLTVVGTNYRTYNIQASSWLNRLFSMGGEFGMNYNRSDGLVKQTSAQIPGAPRTFVHKCHGGFDSLVTARESFEVAARFLFGNLRARLRLVKAKITRGKDWFGKSEFFFGVSIKPRRVDFDLFHQSVEAENCYGPFSRADLSDSKPAFDWAGPGRLIWEGWLDTEPIFADPSIDPKDMVLRLDFYVGERDLFGIGFSDNVIFRKQYYIRALFKQQDGAAGAYGFDRLYLHADERFAQPGFRPNPAEALPEAGGGWEFQVKGTGFEATFRIEVEAVA